MSTIATAQGQSNPSTLPHGFVRLADMAPTIVEDMRYASVRNFTGAVVPGYGPRSQCVLKARTAQALAKVAEDLAPRGLGLMVFDCYRPIRAVSAFMAWTRRAPLAQGPHHPGLTRSELVGAGYIASVSGHSRGNVVDLTLVRLIDGRPSPVDNTETATPCTEAPTSPGAVDLGTGFDCFSPRAHYGARGLASDAQANRQVLRQAMERRGFSAYSREWWHFSFNDGATERYDFPVPQRPD